MELRHFRYFVRVAEELHFGRAAAQLGISQPPLSQQIRALEQELGVDLFERTSRRVRLTEAGELFLEEARRTLEQVEHAAETARRVRMGEIGRLAIGFTASAPFVPMIANALFHYRSTYPSVHMELAEMPPALQIDAVAEGRLHAGFIRSFDPPAMPAGVLATALLEEELLVAMRRDHRLASCAGPLTIAHLEQEPMVLYERRFGAGFNEHIAQLFRAAGQEPNIIQEASGLATLLGLVAAGFGITVLTRSLSALHLDDVTYRPLDEPNAVSRLWLVQHAQPSPACRRFTAILEEQARS